MKTSTPQHYWTAPATLACPLAPDRLLIACGPVPGYFVQNVAGEIVPVSEKMQRQIEAVRGPAMHHDAPTPYPIPRPEDF